MNRIKLILMNLRQYIYWFRRTNKWKVVDLTLYNTPKRAFSKYFIGNQYVKGYSYLEVITDDPQATYGLINKIKYYYQVIDFELHKDKSLVLIKKCNLKLTTYNYGEYNHISQGVKDIEECSFEEYLEHYGFLKLYK